MVKDLGDQQLQGFHCVLMLTQCFSRLLLVIGADVGIPHIEGTEKSD